MAESRVFRKAEGITIEGIGEACRIFCVPPKALWYRAARQERAM